MEMYVGLTDYEWYLKQKGNQQQNGLDSETVFMWVYEKDERVRINIKVDPKRRDFGEIPISQYYLDTIQVRCTGIL